MTAMKLKITYYLDVASSWCFLAEPAWAALKERYAAGWILTGRSH